MNIIVTATHVPFIQGGAESHMQGLVHALKQAGHQVELIRIPFQFQPESQIHHTMDYLRQLDLSEPNGQRVDRLISLQFPTFAIRHPDHHIWVMHQHRAAYELYNERQATAEQRSLKEAIHQYDNHAFAQAKALYANSKNVAARLQKYNQVSAQALYHPPPQAEHLYVDQAQGYIYCPSRLEKLKRQDLLIQAAGLLKHSRLKFLISGNGGLQQQYQALIEQHGLQDKVILLGRVSDCQKRTLYANADAIFFAPHDEDYGYITLEAMLSHKPVITCTDSGGVLEFVKHQQTGWIVEPDPQQIADIIAQIEHNPEQAKRYGQQGYQSYQSHNISWQNVVQTLTQ
jgi:glycosyltransferase involved in cell wall biosynthesis